MKIIRTGDLAQFFFWPARHSIPLMLADVKTD